MVEQRTIIDEPPGLLKIVYISFACAVAAAGTLVVIRCCGLRLTDDAILRNAIKAFFIVLAVLLGRRFLRTRAGRRSILL